MMRVIGVMGGGERSTPEVCRLAYRTGYLIAREGWVLLNGGLPVGVMEAAARGAKEGGGLTVGIPAGKESRGGFRVHRHPHSHRDGRCS